MAWLPELQIAYAFEYAPAREIAEGAPVRRELPTKLLGGRMSKRLRAPEGKRAASQPVVLTDKATLKQGWP